MNKLPELQEKLNPEYKMKLNNLILVADAVERISEITETKI